MDESKDIQALQRPWLIASLAAQGTLLLAATVTKQVLAHGGDLWNWSESRFLAVRPPVFSLAVAALYFLASVCIKYYPLCRLPKSPRANGQAEALSLSVLVDRSIYETAWLCLIPTGAAALYVLWPRAWLLLPLGVWLVELAVKLTSGAEHVDVSGQIGSFDDHPDWKARLFRLLEESEDSGLAGAKFVLLESGAKVTDVEVGVAGTLRKPALFLNDRFFERFDASEQRVILQHEVAHCRHRDPLRRKADEATARLVAIALGCLFVWLAAPNGDVIRVAAAIPGFMLAMWLGDTMAEPVLLWLSRRRERLANEWALEHTNNPAAFCSAMRKLADANRAHQEPTLVDKLLFTTHPSLNEVLQQARRYAREHDVPGPANPSAAAGTGD